MSSAHTSDIFIVKLGNKCIDIERKKILVRTDTGRFFDITGSCPLTDRHIDECNGLVRNAKQVMAQYVADLLATSFDSASQSGTTNNSKDTLERKVFSKIMRRSRRLQQREKEVYVQ